MEEEDFLGDVVIPGGGGAMLSLFKRGAEFSLRVRDIELMTSLVHESEDALATLVCERLAAVPQPILLIGGLGMGYTLAAALKELGPGAIVVVSELISAVVEWNRGPLAHLAGRPLSDARVQVRVGDVARILRAEPAAFDGILLDVDNGPRGLTRKSNNWLYSEDGLAAAYAALRPGGVLAVWSSGPEKSFAMRLRKIGFEAEEVHVTSHGPELEEADRHTIWLATKGP
jgi:spermidine synthase